MSVEARTDSSFRHVLDCDGSSLSAQLGGYHQQTLEQSSQLRTAAFNYQKVGRLHIMNSLLMSCKLKNVDKTPLHPA